MKSVLIATAVGLVPSWCRCLLLALAWCCLQPAWAQQPSLNGRVLGPGQVPVPFASVLVLPGPGGTTADASGNFSYKLKNEAQTLRVRFSAAGFLSVDTVLALGVTHEVHLAEANLRSEEVVLTGGLKPIAAGQSVVQVESYRQAYLQRFAPASLFESMRFMAGVQPQTLCTVCHTGDIHINGQEGANTLVMIDGIPIVSALSTIYGLQGIPISMLARLEVLKGPAGALYGSEALAGAINIITQGPGTAPRASAGLRLSHVGERTLHAGATVGSGGLRALLGAEQYSLQNRMDLVKDGMMDVPLITRNSLFGTLTLGTDPSRSGRLFARLVGESRTGGSLAFSPQQKGNDSVYGEQIDTRRLELAGSQNLVLGGQPFQLWYGYNYHHQRSHYGTTYYQATQQVGFGQLVHSRPWGQGYVLEAGAGLRYTSYIDNTPFSSSGRDSGQFAPVHTTLPGVLLQNNFAWGKRHSSLLGARLDHHPFHGPIFTPRANHRWVLNENHTLRLGLGSGFRVVNLVTEDHAATTGSRTVVIAEELQPERSLNATLNHNAEWVAGPWLLGLQSSLFHTRFSNQILPDYDSNPDQIIYSNLGGHSVSQGLNTTLTAERVNSWYLSAGLALLNVYQVNDGQREEVVYAPPFSGHASAAYQVPRLPITLTYGVEVGGPRPMPVQPSDPRPSRSPWFALHNVEASGQLGRQWELKLGVSNLLNYLPIGPLLRPHDPFDRQVDDPVDNPQGHTFDTAYSYAPMWGRRAYVGLNWVLR